MILFQIKLGVYNWDKYTSDFVHNNSVQLNVDSRNDFFKFVKYVCEEFKLFIEEQSGYKLLWDDEKKRGKREESAQLVFHGIVRSYCKINNTDISREPNIGRGPVDFKFSKGYKDRVLLEVKLARNSKFWSGITMQLPQYMKSEDINMGVFMVVVYTDTEIKKISQIQDIVSEVSNKVGYKLDFIVIDARMDKLSASNL